MKVCVIPARGGSKRIPRKNIKIFCGKPVIAYSIEAAQKSGLFDKVIVSTDDEKIAQVAKDYGALVPFVRPSSLSGDYASTVAVITHALDWLKEQGFNTEYVCCLYATAPFVLVKYIKQSLEILINSGKSYSFPITVFPFPIQRALVVNKEDDCIEAMFSEHISSRSQDLVEAYHDAGQFYWGKVSAYEAGINEYFGQTVPIIIPHQFVQDIDTPDDWENAELMYKIMQSKGLLD